MTGRIATWSAAAMALLGCMNATCGAFAVAPIRVELRAGQTAGELTVHNDTDKATLIQLRAAEWSQQDDAEQYTETRDLLVTPPVFTLPANGEQIIRVALRRPPDAARELSYRLFIQEVPPAANPELRQLTLALRISLPVFVAPAAKSRARVEWQGHWLQDGRFELRADNAGNAHLQITDFDVQVSGGAAVTGSRANKYLLPGSTARWTLDMPTNADHAQAITLHGHSDQGDFNAAVALDHP
jgi:fimbrial chaperone protein